MLGYLEIDAFKDGLEVELVKENRHGEFSIKYHNTTQKIFEVSDRIKGIVIPYQLVGHDYNILLMILHIRLFLSDKLSQLPIIVHTESEDDYLHFFANQASSEQVYNSVGVSIPDPTQLGDFELLSVNKTALKDFLQEKAGFPWFTQGRHDQANRWGPYVFLYVLNEVLGDCSGVLASVEEKMFAEPYLKRLASGICDHSTIGHVKTDLVWAQQKLKAELEKIEHKKILIVEDKLDDGWKYCYETVLLGDGLDIEISWAKTKKEAEDHFSKELALVILDMRLVNDNAPEDHPAGIKLAKKFRQLHPLVPIIAATASNKSWMLQELTDQGIDAYWVKASPEIDLDFSHAAQNVLDFYRKLTATLEWSSKTRKWTEALYHIAGVVTQHDPINGKGLRAKACSFHALMKKSFSPFSEEISAGLQQNLAFLIAYSCMNDLVSWVLKFEPIEGDDAKIATWDTDVNGDREELLRQCKNRWGEVHYEIKNNNKKFDKFPDKIVALEVFRRYHLTKQKQDFMKMSDLRNGLPHTHGKSAEIGTSSARVSSVDDEDVLCMINILSDLVNAHNG